MGDIILLTGIMTVLFGLLGLALLAFRGGLIIGLCCLFMFPMSLLVALIFWRESQLACFLITTGMLTMLYGSLLSPILG